MARTCPHCGEKILVSVALTKSVREQSFKLVNIETAKALIQKGFGIAEMAQVFNVTEDELRKVFRHHSLELVEL